MTNACLVHWMSNRTIKQTTTPTLIPLLSCILLQQNLHTQRTVLRKSWSVRIIRACAVEHTSPPCTRISTPSSGLLTRTHKSPSSVHLGLNSAQPMAVSFRSSPVFHHHDLRLFCSVRILREQIRHPSTFQTEKKERKIGGEKDPPLNECTQHVYTFGDGGPTMETRQRD